MWKWKLWMSLLLGLQTLCLIGGLLLILLALYHERRICAAWR